MSGTYRALVEIRYAVWVDVHAADEERARDLAVTVGEDHHRRRHQQDPDDAVVIGDLDLTDAQPVRDEWARVRREA